MTNYRYGDFNVPDGYDEEEIEGKLYYEDLNDDSELWLIRVPSDIQLSALDKKKIHIGSNSDDVNVKNIKTENGKILECCAENCDIPNMYVVLPEKNKKLKAVSKVFKGALLISQGLSLNDDTKVKDEIDDDSQATAIDYTRNVTHESRKTSKKGKRDSENDFDYETEDANYTNRPIRKHKYSKKRTKINKSSNESTEIKSEPESVDSDGFPACRSQN